MTGGVSAVVCTHNRSQDAIECVEKLVGQLHSQSVEVILVDSASDGSHASALADYVRGRCQNVQLVRSEVPGLSVARNCAAAVASSTWLAFLDDDARPAPDWWETAQAISNRVPDDVAVVGGRILPCWPAARPSYVGRRWLMFLSCIEEPTQDGVNPMPECYGANLMVRRSALHEVGGFPTQLGRVGNMLLSGEESVLQQLLQQRGATIKYDGQLTVEHLIQSERLTLSWIKRRAFWGGVSEVVSARIRGVRPAHLNLGKAVLAACLLRLARIFGDTDSDLLIRARYADGIVVATCRGILGQKDPTAGPQHSAARVD